MKFAFIMKQNQILIRTLRKSQVVQSTTNQDRIFVASLMLLDKKLSSFLVLVKPKTVLKVWKKIQMSRYTNKIVHRQGRPHLKKETKTLILEMKKANWTWGYRRITGELKKLHIEASFSSVRRVLEKGRKDGMIQSAGSWKDFIHQHSSSLFCCDFLTVETLFNKRLYVFFIMKLANRKIVQYGVSSRPEMMFVRNQLTGFMYDKEDEKTYLVHDNSGELKWMDYESVGIKGVAITPYSPNMNACAERFVKSIRNECLDHFIVVNKNHLRNLVKAYINFYNRQRPHQARDNIPPEGTVCKDEKQNCVIKREKVLFGLYQNYYLSAS